MAKFESFRPSKLNFLAGLHDTDHMPVNDFDYPCATFDWDDSGKVKISGNVIDQEVYIVASLYEADGHPPDAHRRLRTYLRPWQEALRSVRGGSDGGYIYAIQLGPVKTGQRLGGGTHTAAAFCRITVKIRGPL